MRNYLSEKQIRRLNVYLNLLKDVYVIYKDIPVFKDKGEKRLFQEVEFINSILTKGYYLISEKKTLISYENRYQNYLKD